MNRALIFLTILIFIKSSWQQENGFLLASRMDRVNRIDPLTGRVDMIFNGKDVSKSPTKRLTVSGTKIQADFDTKYNCLYFSFGFEIIKKCLEGNQTEHVIANYVYYAGTIAYDSKSELLYFYSSNVGKLESVKIVNNANQAVKINHKRRTLNEIQRRNVIVDPVHKYMFWTTSEPNSIWRSNLDGSEAKIIVNNSFLQKPEKITFDQSTNHIYWTDSVDNTIGHCDLNGDSVVIRKLKFWPFHKELSFKKIAVSGSRIFLYDYNSQLIFFVEKDKDVGDFFCAPSYLSSLKFISTPEKLHENYSAAEYCNCTLMCNYEPKHDKSFACLFEGDLDQPTTGYCHCDNCRSLHKPSMDDYCSNVNLLHRPSGSLILAALLPIHLALKF